MPAGEVRSTAPRLAGLENRSAVQPDTPGSDAINVAVLESLVISSRGHSDGQPCSPRPHGRRGAAALGHAHGAERHPPRLWRGFAARGPPPAAEPGGGPLCRPLRAPPAPEPHPPPPHGGVPSRPRGGRTWPAAGVDLPGPCLAAP